VLSDRYRPLAAAACGPAMAQRGRALDLDTNTPFNSGTRRSGQSVRVHLEHVAHVDDRSLTVAEAGD